MIQNKTEIFLKHLVNPQQFDLLEKDEEAFKDAIENWKNESDGRKKSK